jgi:hypothetical protein
MGRLSKRRANRLAQSCEFRRVPFEAHERNVVRAKDVDKVLSGCAHALSVNLVHSGLAELVGARIAQTVKLVK